MSEADVSIGSSLVTSVCVVVAVSSDEVEVVSTLTTVVDVVVTEVFSVVVVDGNIHSTQGKPSEKQIFWRKRK